MSRDPVLSLPQTLFNEALAFFAKTDKDEQSYSGRFFMTVSKLPDEYKAFIYLKAHYAWYYFLRKFGDTDIISVSHSIPDVKVILRSMGKDKTHGLFNEDLLSVFFKDVLMRENKQSFSCHSKSTAPLNRCLRPFTDMLKVMKKYFSKELTYSVPDIKYVAYATFVTVSPFFEKLFRWFDSHDHARQYGYLIYLKTTTIQIVSDDVFMGPPLLKEVYNYVEDVIDLESGAEVEEITTEDEPAVQLPMVHSLSSLEAFAASHHGQRHMLLSLVHLSPLSNFVSDYLHFLNPCSEQRERVRSPLPKARAPNRIPTRMMEEVVSFTAEEEEAISRIISSNQQSIEELTESDLTLLLQNLEDY